MKIIVYEVRYLEDHDEGWKSYSTTDPVAFHKKYSSIVESFDPLFYNPFIYTKEAIAGEF